MPYPSPPPHRSGDPARYPPCRGGPTVPTYDDAGTHRPRSGQEGVVPDDEPVGAAQDSVLPVGEVLEPRCDEPPRQLRHHNPALEPGQRRAEAEVDAAAEGE